MQQIIHNIPLIAQEKDKQSFVAALSMLLSWKSGKLLDIAAISQDISNKNNSVGEMTDDRLSMDIIASIAKSERIDTVASLPHILEDLALLIFQSPVLVVFFSPEKKNIVYTVVITGIMGNGEPDTSYVHIHDPYRLSKGKKYKISVLDFITDVEEWIALFNDIDVKNTHRQFYYYDFSAKMTITSMHHSVSEKTTTHNEQFEWKKK
jgi:hypothetical protein